jgi:pre-mRNA-splicing factor CWC22
MEVASAVRLPTPEPADTMRASVGKRKRSPPSRSPSPRRHRSPPHRRSYTPSPARDNFQNVPYRDQAAPSGPMPKDVDRARAMERQRQLELRKRNKEGDESKPVTEEQKQAAAKKEYDALVNKRSGGVYIPPARLRALQAQITDKNSKEFQRMAWEALKKSINGLINKVNVSNIKFIVPELFGENLVRGRGLFCRSIMKAQSASLPFSAIFAASAAIVNTKLPQVGELLAKRLVVQFRKAFKRNDKVVCISSTTFLAHLCNQQVIHEMLIAQILLLLLHQPTDDSVEIAVNLCKECGQHLEEFNSAIAVAVFDQFRSILHESTDLEKRTQYMIEVLFQVRRDKYKDYPAIREELDLVEEEDQITHKVDLEGDIDTQDSLNVFKFDANYETSEQGYQKLKAEILGEADDSDEDEDDDMSDDSEDNEEAVKERELEIKDQTNTDLVNLRRSIYLTIKASGSYEEAVHRLVRIFRTIVASLHISSPFIGIRLWLISEAPPGGAFNVFQD